MRTKDQAIMEDFILPNYDKRKKEYEAIKTLYEINPELLNVELLAEITLNRIVGAVESDGVHTDAVSRCGKIKYEWKTATVYTPTMGNSINCHKLEIKNCASNSGIEKQGHLGVIVFNKVRDRIDYLVIPQQDVKGMLNSNGAKTAIKRIIGTYNNQRDDYSDKLWWARKETIQSFKEALVALK